jgi:uncharacterized protein (TIGR00251 family)
MPPRPEDTLFALRVTPRSSKNAVRVEDDGSLKIWVTAAPVDGKANTAVCELLAKRLKISKNQIELLSGDASRVKRIAIFGMAREDVISRLDGNSNPY